MLGKRLGVYPKISITKQRNMPTRTPKDSFLSSPHRREWDEIMGKDSFHFACDYALLVLEDSLPLRATPNEAADCHQQMIGARKVLDILKTLSEPVTKPKPFNPPSLNYDTPYAKPNHGTATGGNS